MTQSAKAVPPGQVLRAGSIGGLKTYKPAELTSHINMMVYGEPGIGKTLLCGSAVEVECLRPVLVINIEDGAKTLKGRYGSSNDIEIVTPRTFGQVQRIFDELQQKRGAGFKTCIIDNATEAQKVGIEYIFESEDNKEGKDFTDFLSATFANQGWNRSSEQMRKMIRYFRTLPMHKLFVAWRKDYSKDPKTEHWGPAFSNTLGREVPGLFDSVFYYYYKMVTETDPKTKKTAQSRKRVLLTEGQTNIVAKDRDDGNTLPTTIIEPTMEKLCRMWGMIE